MIIVANWKAYVENPTKAKALVAAGKRVAAKGVVDIVLAPPAPLLGTFALGTKPGKKSLSFAAQDLSDSTGGAATGEVTAALLSGIGVTHVILGHSERRAQGETDEIVVSKIQHALAHNLTPIVCIGEKTRDADAQYLQTLRAQITSIFERLNPKERMRIVLAYEPIWAIGKSAAESITPADLHEMVLYLRKVLSSFFSDRAALSVPILYGGSVEPGNIRTLAAGGQVQGFLIGHASVEPQSFTALAKAVS
jgi:triosephosphate isomerase (TIM)